MHATHMPHTYMNRTRGSRFFLFACLPATGAAVAPEQPAPALGARPFWLKSSINLACTSDASVKRGAMGRGGEKNGERSSSE